MRRRFRRDRTRPGPSLFVVVEAAPLSAATVPDAEQRRSQAPADAVIDTAIAAFTTDEVTEAADGIVEDDLLFREERQESHSAPIATSGTLTDLRSGLSRIQVAPIERDGGLIELSPLEFDLSEDGSRDKSEPWQIRGRASCPRSDPPLSKRLICTVRSSTLPSRRRLVGTPEVAA